MNNIMEAFSNLATVGGLIDVVIGFILAYIFNFIWCHRHHKRAQVNWRYIGIAIGCIMIAFTSIQTQVAYNTAKKTAQEVRDCQREFNSALQARSQITSENDEVSQNQRRIVFNWIHSLIFPPEPYASMDPNDPRRQAFGISLTIKTEHEFQASLNYQDELQKARDTHQLPEPTCGKG